MFVFWPLNTILCTMEHEQKEKKSFDIKENIDSRQNVLEMETSNGLRFWMLSFGELHLGTISFVAFIDLPTALNRSEKAFKCTTKACVSTGKYSNEPRANQHTASRTHLPHIFFAHTHTIFSLRSCRFSSQIKYRKKLPWVTFTIVDYTHSNNANKRERKNNLYMVCGIPVKGVRSVKQCQSVRIRANACVGRKR